MPALLSLLFGGGGAVKIGAKGAKLAGLGVKAIERAGRVGGAALASVSGGGEYRGNVYNDVMKIPYEVLAKNSKQFQDAKARGMSDEQAREYAASTLDGRLGKFLGASATGIADYGGPVTLAFAGEEAAKKGLRGLIGATLKEGGQEALQEGGTQYLSNLAVKDQDPSKNEWENVGLNAGVGAALGGIAGGGLHGVHSFFGHGNDVNSTVDKAVESTKNPALPNPYGLPQLGYTPQNTNPNSNNGYGNGTLYGMPTDPNDPNLPNNGSGGNALAPYLVNTQTNTNALAEQGSSEPTVPRNGTAQQAVQANQGNVQRQDQGLAYQSDRIGIDDQFQANQGNSYTGEQTSNHTGEQTSNQWGNHSNRQKGYVAPSAEVMHLANQFGNSPRRVKDIANKLASAIHLDTVQELAQSNQPEGAAARAYLQSRGITIEAPVNQGVSAKNYALTTTNPAMGAEGNESGISNTNQNIAPVSGSPIKPVVTNNGQQTRGNQRVATQGQGKSKNILGLDQRVVQVANMYGETPPQKRQIAHQLTRAIATNTVGQLAQNTNTPVGKAATKYLEYHGKPKGEVTSEQVGKSGKVAQVGKGENVEVNDHSEHGKGTPHSSSANVQSEGHKNAQDHKGSETPVQKDHGKSNSSDDVTHTQERDTAQDGKTVAKDPDKVPTTNTATLKKRIVNFVRNVLSNKSKYGWINLMPVSDKLRNDLKKLGFNNIGEHYTHIIDSSAVVHINNNHGNQKVESNRGQKVVDEEGYKSIVDVLNNYDSVSIGDKKSGTGKDTIKFRKNIGNGEQLVVEEIREGKGRLSVVTSYILKRPLVASAISDKRSASATSETTRGPTESVPKPTEKVNSPDDSPNKIEAEKQQSSKESDHENDTDHVKLNDEEDQDNYELRVTEDGQEGTIYFNLGGGHYVEVQDISLNSKDKSLKDIYDELKKYYGEYDLSDVYNFYMDDDTKFSEIVQKVRQLKNAEFTRSTRHASESERVGKDYLQNKNATPSQLKEDIGFKNVTVDEQIPAREQQTLLNKTYNAFADLAQSLNLPLEAISLNGQLKLSFSSEVRSNNAYYDSKTQTLYISSRSKHTGAIAHAWLAALDEYSSGAFYGKHYKGKLGRLSDEYKKSAIYLEEKNKFAPKNVATAWKNLKFAFKDTKAYKRLLRYINLRNLSNPHNPAAYMGEMYLKDKLKEKGLRNDFLVNIDERKTDTYDWPYPTGKEKEAFSKAYDDLFDTLRTATLDGKPFLGGHQLEEHPPESKSKPQTKPQQTKPSTNEGLSVSESKKTKIEDFGEKIEGARKHAYTHKLSEALNKDLFNDGIAKAWPEPNYTKMIEDGVSKKDVATLRALRDLAIAHVTANKKHFKEDYIRKEFNALRTVAKGILDGEVKLEDNPKFKGLQAVASLYEKYGHDKSLKGVEFIQRRNGQWLAYHDRSVVNRLFTGKTYLTNDHETLDQAVKEFEQTYFNDKDGGKEPEAPKGKSPYNVYYSRDRSSKKVLSVYIGRKIGKNIVKLKTFEFEEGKANQAINQAHTYIKENSATLDELFEKQKFTQPIRTATEADRIGKDYRNGKDATQEMFIKDIGFRGVQFGNWVNQKERQTLMNKAYDAFMDLAHVLNIPVQTLSLNGELGLSFAARGKGGKDSANAHYEPGQVVINLTKRKGAGSLAHEWFHALDNYFAKNRQSGESSTAFASEAGRLNKNAREEVAQAWAELTKTIKESQFYERSSKSDTTRSKDYWSTTPELVARAGEMYIKHKLEQSGHRNDFLVNIDESETGNDLWVYPRGQEKGILAKAYDKLFSTFKVAVKNGRQFLESRANKQDAVASVKGDELGTGLTSDNVIERARSWFKANLQGGIVEREGFGKVRISGKSWQKLRWGLIEDLDKAKLIPAIPDIIRKGNYGGRSPLYKERKDGFVAFHYFEAPVELNGKTVQVGITVAEDKNGNLFYNLNRDPQQLFAKRKTLKFPDVRDRESRSFNETSLSLRTKSQGVKSHDQSIHQLKSEINIDVYESESRSKQNTNTGISKSKLNEVIKGFANLKDKSGVRIEIKPVSSFSELPEHIRQNLSGENFTEGLYVPASDGQPASVYLIANNISSVERAKQVLAHELVGHFGMEATLGKDYGLYLNHLDRLESNYGKLPSQEALRKATPNDRYYASKEAVQALYPDYTPSQVLQEVLARMAERSEVLGGKPYPFAQKVFRKMKLFFAKMGLVNLNLKDIEYAVRDAAVRLREGKFSMGNTDKAYQSINTVFDPHGLDESKVSAFTKLVDLVRLGKGLGKTVILGKAPSVLQMLGMPSVDVKMTSTTMSKVMDRKHNVSAEDLKNITKQLNNPIAVMKNPPHTKEGYVVLTELSEIDRETGRKLPIIAAIHIDKQGNGEINFLEIKSVYGKNLEGLAESLNKGLLYWNKSKGSQFLNRSRLPMPSPIQNSTSLDVSKIKTESDLSQYLKDNLAGKNNSRPILESRQRGGAIPDITGTATMRDYVRKMTDKDARQTVKDFLTSGGEKPHAKFLDTVITNLFDYRDPLSNLLKRFKTPSAKRLEQTMRLYEASTQKAIHDFEQSRYEPMMKDLEKVYKEKFSKEYKAFGKDGHRQFLQDLSTVANLIKHGKERNAEILRKTQGKDKAGSGRTDEQIDQLEKEMRQQVPGLIEFYEGFYQSHLKPMLDLRDKVLKDSGLLTQEMINARPKYKWYVPLTGDPDGDSPDRLSRQFSSKVTDPRDKKAKGRAGTLADNVLQNVLEGTHNAIKRSGQQVFKRDLVDFVLANPQAKSLLKAKINTNGYKEIYEKYVDKNGIVKERIKPSAVMDDNAIVYRNGNNVTILQIGDQRVLEAIQGINRAVIEGVFSLPQKGTRFLSSIYTRFNVPMFPLMNKLRDTQSMAALMMADAPTQHKFKAMRAMLADNVRFTTQWRSGQNKDSDYFKWKERYEKLGGSTMYSDIFKDDVMKNIEDEFAKGVGATTKAQLGRLADTVGKVVDGINEHFEMTTRVAAFKALVENGVNEREAALYVKNTMNFETKGKWGQQIGALYAFANPALFDARRVLRSLRTPRGAVVMAAHFAIMYMLYGALKAMGGKDDDDIDRLNKVPLSQSGRYLTFIDPTDPEGKGFKVPVGFGYGRIALTLAAALHRWIDGVDETDTFLANVAKEGLAANFSPLEPVDIDPTKDFTGYVVQQFAPTIARPMVQLGMNTTGQGSPIHMPDAWVGQKLHSQVAWPATNELWRNIAKSVFDATGIDIYPETLRYLTQNYLGSPGMEVARAFMLGDEKAGTQWGASDIPFVQAFSHKGSRYDMATFRNSEEGVQRLMAERKYAYEQGQDQGYEFDQEHPGLLQANAFFNAVEKQMKPLYKERKNVYATIDDPMEKQERIKLLNQRIRVLEMMANKAFKEIGNQM